MKREGTKKEGTSEKKAGKAAGTTRGKEGKKGGKHPTLTGGSYCGDVVIGERKGGRVRGKMLGEDGYARTLVSAGQEIGQPYGNKRKSQTNVQSRGTRKRSCCRIRTKKKTQKIAEKSAVSSGL